MNGIVLFVNIGLFLLNPENKHNTILSFSSYVVLLYFYSLLADLSESMESQNPLNILVAGHPGRRLPCVSNWARALPAAWRVGRTTPKEASGLTNSVVWGALGVWGRTATQGGLWTYKFGGGSAAG